MPDTLWHIENSQAAFKYETVLSQAKLRWGKNHSLFSSCTLFGNLNWWRWTKALESQVVFRPAPVCFSNSFFQFDYLISRIWISNWLDRFLFHLNLFDAPDRFLFCKIPRSKGQGSKVSHQSRIIQSIEKHFWIYCSDSRQISVFMRTLLSCSVFPTLTFPLLFLI